MRYSLANLSFVSAFILGSMVLPGCMSVSEEPRVSSSASSDFVVSSAASLGGSSSQIQSENSSVVSSLSSSEGVSSEAVSSAAVSSETVSSQAVSSEAVSSEVMASSVASVDAASSESAVSSSSEAADEYALLQWIESEDYSNASNVQLLANRRCEGSNANASLRPVKFQRPGNCNVANLGDGSWLEYKVNVATEGAYDIGLVLEPNTTVNGGIEVRVDRELSATMTIVLPEGRIPDFIRFVINDVVLPAGESTLRITVRNGVSVIDALAVGTALDSETGVVSMSLIDTDTGLPLEGYENLDPNGEYTLNLNDLPTKNFLLAYEGNFYTETINYIQWGVTEETLDNSNFWEYIRANYMIERPFYNNPYFGQVLTPWRLAESLLIAEGYPFRFTRSEGYTKGPHSSAIFRFLRDEIKAQDETLNFVGAMGEIPIGEITLTNNGTFEGGFSLLNPLEWLSLSQTEGTIAVNATVSIVAEAKTACQDTSVLQGNIILKTSSGERSLDVSLICSESEVFDLMIDRVYISQAISAADSKPEFEPELPLLTDRMGIMRVFVTANEFTTDIPVLELHYRKNGEEGVATFEAPTQLLQATDEGTLETTYNLRLETDFITSDLEYFIELNNKAEISEATLDNNRWPASGYYQPQVQELDEFHAIFVPITLNGVESGVTQEFAEQAMALTKAQLPIGAYRLELRDPMMATGTIYDVASLLDALKIQEQNTDAYYHALINREGNTETQGTSGIGAFAGTTAVSQLELTVIPHEFGHNLALGHTDCGIASFNPDYPFVGADIGEWAYDYLSGTLVSPETKDLMSYCDPSWTSRYTMVTALEHRLSLMPSSPAGQQRKASIANFTDYEEVTWLTGTASYFLGQTQLRITQNFSAPAKSIEPSDLVINAYSDTGELIYSSYVAIKAYSHGDTKTFTAPVITTGAQIITFEEQGVEILRLDVTDI